ncbi:MAG TPA: TA system VapC family ribonuclease toxin [Acidobacteriaceae bacterium]|jgi:hypothetical protein
MSSSKCGTLLDLNCLIALVDPDHQHHQAMHSWFQSSGHHDWGICPLTEAGFVRVTTNPAYGRGPRTIAQAGAILAGIPRSPGYRFWPITESWGTLTAPFSARLFGHQQATDAYLLGLAVREGGVLVTFDKGIQYLAGPEYSKHVQLLELRA